MYHVKLHTPAWLHGVGLVFKVNETKPFLQHILISHKKIDTKSHLGDLHKDAGTGLDTSKMTVKKAREELINHVFSGQDELVTKCMTEKEEEQTYEMDTERADNIGDMMEEIFLHDDENATEFKGVFQQAKKQRRQALTKKREEMQAMKNTVNKLRKKLKATQVNTGKKWLGAKKNAKKGTAEKGTKPPTAEKGPAENVTKPQPPLAPDPPLPPPEHVPPDPPPEHVPPVHVPPESQAGHAKMYTTPELIDMLQPPGGKITIDVPGVRWRGRYHDNVIPSIGFGPYSPYNRRTALEAILDFMWKMHGGDRPLNTYVGSLPAEWWQGFLDPLEEQPRKYTKK